MKIIENFIAARRVGTPLIALACFDPEATMQILQKEIIESGKKKSRTMTIIQWDVIRGWVPRTEESKEGLAKALMNLNDPEAGSIPQEMTCDPVEHLVHAAKFPEDTVLFCINADAYTDKAPFIQAVWNLRDLYKSSRRTLVLLGPSFKLPEALQQDVLMLDEELPTDNELGGIVERMSKSAGVVIDDEIKQRAVDSLRGLPTFPAEQATAMCMTKSGLNLDMLWDRKRSLISQTPGLSVFRDGMKFDDLGGLDEIKKRLLRIINGKAPPKVLVFLDEIEKAMANEGHSTEQDQLGVILTEMTEKNYTGLLGIGPPGAAKSAFAKAVGNEAGVLTIKLDLGAMKGEGLVGQAEKEIRRAFKVIEAVGGQGGAFFIATSNDIRVVKPELKRRFRKGIWYFDLPDVKEREVIWKIYKKKYDLLKDKSFPKGDNDDGWTGAEIESCCLTAWEENITLAESAKGIIPVAVAASSEIQRLRSEATGRYNSVSKSGPYVFTGRVGKTVQKRTERSVELDD